MAKGPDRALSQGAGWSRARVVPQTRRRARTGEEDSPPRATEGHGEEDSTRRAAEDAEGDGEEDSPPRHRDADEEVVGEGEEELVELPVMDEGDGVGVGMGGVGTGSGFSPEGARRELVAPGCVGDGVGAESRAQVSVAGPEDPELALGAPFCGSRATGGVGVGRGAGLGACFEVGFGMRARDSRAMVVAVRRMSSAWRWSVR